MTIIQRRIYYTTTVILFIVLAPLIVYLTSGYQFNFKEWRFIKTGVIIVDSAPSGATVSINGVVQGSTTPARISSLTPGTYTVSVQKTDHRGWQSTIPVYPNRSTIVGTPLLFLSDPTIMQVGPITDPKNIWSNPDQTHTAFVSQKTNELVLLTGAAAIKKSLPSGTLSSIQWSPDTVSVLATTDTHTFFTSKADAVDAWHPVPTLDGLTYEQLVWKNNSTLIAQVADKLFKISITDGTITTIMPDSAATADIIDGFVWIITTDNQLVQLDQNDEVRLRFDLPATGFRFGTRNSSGAIALYHKKQHELLLLRTRSLTHIPLTFSPETVIWDTAHTNLLVANSTDIWALHRTTEYTPELVTRTATVSSVQWFRGSHIVYTVGGTVTIIDTSPVRQHTAETLFTDSSLQRVIGSTKDAVYLTVGGSEPGLYQLTVL